MSRCLVWMNEKECACDDFLQEIIHCVNTLGFENQGSAMSSDPNATVATNEPLVSSDSKEPTIEVHAPTSGDAAPSNADDKASAAKELKEEKSETVAKETKADKSTADRKPTEAEYRAALLSLHSGGAPTIAEEKDGDDDKDEWNLNPYAALVGSLSGLGGFPRPNLGGLFPDLPKANSRPQDKRSSAKEPTKKDREDDKEEPKEDEETDAEEEDVASEERDSGDRDDQEDGDDNSSESVRETESTRNAKNIERRVSRIVGAVESIFDAATRIHITFAKTTQREDVGKTCSKASRSTYKSIHDRSLQVLESELAELGDVPEHI